MENFNLFKNLFCNFENFSFLKNFQVKYLTFDFKLQKLDVKFAENLLFCKKSLIY